MKYFEKCKTFLLFARLRTRRLTAAFSAVLLATVMLTAALFFASCGSPDEEGIELLPPPPPTTNSPPESPASPASSLVITPQSQYLLPAGTTSFDVKLDNTELKGKANLTVSSGQSSEKTYIDETGNLVVGDDQTAGQLTISGTYTEDGKTVNGDAVVEVIVLTNPDDPSIKNKFGITTVTRPDMDPEQEREAAVEAVRKTFTALHLFIQNGGLENKPDVIKLGDYIDLDGGLEVAAYGTGDYTGGFSSSQDLYWDTEIIVEGEVNRGKMDRLIVVGINSFQTNQQVNNDYVYPKTEGENDPPSHVVFQFQNLPVKRRMNPDDSNAGGYPASEMRKYLTPVENNPDSGKFLAGLEKAGVPKGALWGPSRVMSAKNGQQTINDLLWLPTQWEMSGNNDYAIAADEKKENQPKLEYYTSTDLTKKSGNYIDGYPDKIKNYGSYYWLASAYKNDTQFCRVTPGGTIRVIAASLNQGCAPAFCVQ